MTDKLLTNIMAVASIILSVLAITFTLIGNYYESKAEDYIQKTMELRSQRLYGN